MRTLLSLWRFAKSPLGNGLLLAAAILLSLFLFGKWEYSRGVRAEAEAQGRRNIAAAKAAKRKTAQAKAASEGVGKKVEAALVREVIVTKTLIQKVPIYVPTPPSPAAAPTLPLGLVRLHDAAAAGLLSPAPFAPGESPLSPSRIGFPALGATIVENYGTCRETEEKLLGWQAWYAGVAPIFQEEGK